MANMLWIVPKVQEPKIITTKVYSLVLLAVCDAKYNFTMVDVGQYGSNNDSGVLINSEMSQKFEERSFDLPEAESLGGCPAGESPSYLVGDEIFRLKLWLMSPYPGQLSEEKMIFNYILSRARLTIKNTFGILVARWRIFKGPIRAFRENINRYVMAAICLNNYLRQTCSERYCPAGFVDSFDGTGRFKPGEWRRLVKAEGNGCLTDIPNVRESRCTGNAIEMRDAVRDYINSPFGKFPWQLDHVRRT